MCAIAGEFRFDGRTVAIENLIKMRDTMIHRGPDGEGHYVSPSGQLGLGHRRLSIIDLSSAASQPMATHDGALVISFNGEIYNHAELRRELQSLGQIHWTTAGSDTEVILQAYRQWGVACLAKLRGMFAFAIWDEQNQQLFVARDRIGIKPLYYYHDNTRFLFGSEIKALLAAPDVPRQVNEQALYHFLSFATTPAPETLFQNIHKLPPAHYLLVTRDGVGAPKRYWDVWDKTENLENQNADQIGDRLLEELEVSVNLHKASDVPVGLFLSGGVDSSINTLLFAKGEKNPVNTFTVDYESKLEAHKSEAGFARQIAAMVGAHGHERLLTQQDLLSFLPTIGQLPDEPLADAVCVPTYYVSKMAKDANIKVCQLGEGADELFCGYSAWMRHYRLDQWKQALRPRALRDLALLGLRLAKKDKTFTYDAAKRSFSGGLQFWTGTEAFRHTELMAILSPHLRQKFKNYSAQEVIEPIHKRFVENSPDQSIVQWMGFADLNMRLPENLLMRTDKMGMAASIEARVPFLDHKVVELGMNIPSRFKVLGGEPKFILKHSVRHLLPADILLRKKQGFSVPLEDWFLTGLSELMRSEVKSFCQESGLLDWTAVERLFTEKKALQCWFLMSLALWWKAWITDR